MAYTLYGSPTSPFVRRIRMLIHDLDYDFREMNVFDAKDATLLNKINPLNQIPVLTHDEKTIWDSRQIFQYLNQIHRFESIDWQGENLLTAIEGAMDSGITLLLMKRSDMDVDGPHMYINRQKERIQSVLNFLKPYLEGERAQDWNFANMTLYAFLDWGTFRGIINIENRPECKRFLEIHSSHNSVKATAIPRG